jgi:U32 family peptidase
VKILSPLDKVEEVEALAEAGADELFCGLLTEDWHNRYIAGAINRRPGGGANFTRWEDLQAAVRAAHGHKIPVILTLNEHYYLPEQYPYLREYISRAASLGVDALMVADLALMLTLRDMPDAPKLYISTGGAPFNSETVAFYRDIGAARVTVPRHLTLDEIGEMMRRADGIETEVFVLNSRCPYVDGYCTFQHGLAGEDFPPLYQNACMLPYDIEAQCEPGVPEAELSLEHQQIWQRHHVDDAPCGGCALYELAEMNITAVKIVGRGNVTERKVTDVTFLRGLLDCLEADKPERQEFREIARMRYRETYRRECRVYMCYFPEVQG